MGLPRRKEAGECAFEWCKEPATCAGLCQTHYNWEYYHKRRGHGYVYMKERAEELAELEARCEVKVATMSKPRRKLRAVK